jgi:hypothetical protein
MLLKPLTDCRDRIAVAVAESLHTSQEADHDRIPYEAKFDRSVRMEVLNVEHQLGLLDSAN